MEEDKKFEIRKLKCDICGKTKKIIVKNETDVKIDIENNFKRYRRVENGDIKEHLVCLDCEHTYHIVDGYGMRGYGYQLSTRPRFTRADKNSTPTYGIEMEVAGNIKNIDKIKKLGGYEVSIGYDTSVEGAQFELSYAPGTFYWYNYESKLKPICKLLEKDKWVIKDSATTGMHIHVGNVEKYDLMSGLIYESISNPYFWGIIRIFGERPLNQYCRAIFLNGHHDAISVSEKWGTIEFRIFKMTIDFDKIMNRIKFIRQIINNTDEDGVRWNEFSEESKSYFLNLLKSFTGLRTDQKEAIKKLFEEPKNSNIELSPEESTAYRNLIKRLENYVYRRDYDEDEEYEEEENDEYEENSIIITPQQRNYINIDANNIFEIIESPENN